MYNFEMKTYLVGGAVRDKLLDYPQKERDWVVVGATPEEMEILGYKPVGKDFPVFLHPETGEEYALARTERKSGHGYKGFSFYCDPGITLEQDLSRRDLTINAMAEDGDGSLIDPYGGRQDLDNRIFRHVSEAFVEDPLRVLRVARFAARYHPLGFTIAEETQQLLCELCVSGELQHLTRERIWQEIERAMGESSPRTFIEVLRDCGALKILLPEVDCLFGIPQRKDYHPEIDTGLHVMMSLDIAAQLSDDPVVRFAVLLHDIGKGTTPENVLPRHIGHEERGAKMIEDVCDHLRAPNHYRELAVLVSRYHLLSHKALHLKPGTVLKVLKGMDVMRRPERLEQFLLSAEADARGRLGFEDQPYPSGEWLRQVHQALLKLDISPLLARGYKGQKLGQAIGRQQLDIIAELKASREQSGCD